MGPRQRVGLSSFLLLLSTARLACGGREEDGLVRLKRDALYSVQVVSSNISATSYRCDGRIDTLHSTAAITCSYRLDRNGADRMTQEINGSLTEKPMNDRTNLVIGVGADDPLHIALEPNPVGDGFNGWASYKVPSFNASPDTPVFVPFATA